jgi:stage V sporulation protein AE
MDYLWAFLIGGVFCLIGQLLVDKTSLSAGRILVLFVVAGVALSAAGLYGRLVEVAGAGATVPLTGFGHLLAEGVRQGVQRDGLLGAFSGGLAASAAGLAFVMIMALVVAVIFRRGDKIT